MKIMRGFIVLAGVAALSACGNFKDYDEVEALQGVSAVGSPFTQALTSEYQAFVDSELNDMNDHADALHFARKGIAAARGDVVAPEPVSDWNVGGAVMQELAEARGRLINVFDLGAREIQPQLSAVAQARFDCWIEQQEEGFQTNDINVCRNEFIEALNQLEAQMPAQAPQPAEPVASTTGPDGFDVDPNAPMQAENAMYLVFFDFDQSTLDAGAQSVLDSVAQEVASRSINAVNVTGHADTSGSREYNRKLAMQRANAIRDALVQRGVAPNLMRVDSRGEEQLLVETADGVREPANRRGEITFE